MAWGHPKSQLEANKTLEDLFSSKLKHEKTNHVNYNGEGERLSMGAGIGELFEGL